MIVRYAPDQVAHEDWVHNASPVVGAREMDPAANLELVRYFHDRHVWLLEPERDVLKLTDYPRVSSK